MMFQRLRQALTQFGQRFYRPDHRPQAQPLNKLSLGIIIVIDIVILVQVFSGLVEISRWPLTPAQAYPCYNAWSAYRNDSKPTPEKEIHWLRTALNRNPADPSLELTYRRQAQNHLGQLSPICLNFAAAWDALDTPQNQALLKQMTTKEKAIADLEAANAKIRAEYDSTLLEQIAGQPPAQSINTVAAAQARQTLEANTAQIKTLEQEIQELATALQQQPTSQALLQFLNQTASWSELERGFEQAQFWHPTQQLLLQLVFLLPLITVTGILHRWAWRRHFGLVALMSWHVFVISLIPLVLKIFEFLRVGVIFAAIFNVITLLFGTLLFLISYVYILLIPIVGFGVIKLGQFLFFNPPSQASHRQQKSRCLNCGRKTPLTDPYCAHCGFQQYRECPACHQPTYPYLPYCKQCGAPQGNPSTQG